MTQPLWLTLVEAVSAAAVAIFTGKLYSAQRASNSVLEQQAELMDRQAHLQKAQQRIQEQLAAGELRPLVSVYLSAATSQLLFINLGKYGVEVEGAWVHQHLPGNPGGGKEVAFGAGVQGLGSPSPGKPIFPLGLAPGASVTLSLGGNPLPHEAEVLEVRYRYGVSPEALLSDLWKIERSPTGAPVRLARVWQARPAHVEGM